jgi:hypothetical protein
MSDRGWAIVPVLNADDIEDILGAATPPRERARAHHSQYPKRMESDNTMSIAHRRPNRTSDDERGRPQDAEYVGTVTNEARRRFGQLDNGSRPLPRSRLRSVSYVPSDSSGSIEIIQDVNVRHEHRAPPGEAYGRGRPGSYGGDFVTNAPRTQHNRAQWGGRTHPSGASVVTSSPGARRNDRFDPYIIDREPGLRGGSGEGQRRWRRGTGEVGA